MIAKGMRGVWGYNSCMGAAYLNLAFGLPKYQALSAFEPKNYGIQVYGIPRY